MPNDVLIALLALLGTCFGSLGGILATAKLTNYRLEQLEKKVEKHNNVIERVTALELQNNTLNTRVKSLEDYRLLVEEEMLSDDKK